MSDKAGSDLDVFDGLAAKKSRPSGPAPAPGGRAPASPPSSAAAAGPPPPPPPVAPPLGAGASRPPVPVPPSAPSPPRKSGLPEDDEKTPVPTLKGEAKPGVDIDWDDEDEATMVFDKSI